MTKNDIIHKLELTEHPLEGGYFRRSYESELSTGEDRSRKLMTSIYYLLTDDQPIGYLHKNRSDILHFHHMGASIRYWTVSPEGELNNHILGPNLNDGELPQLLVRGGCWKASELLEGEYGLISEAVAPGFVYEDNELATKELVQALFPDLLSKISSLIKS